MDLHDDAPGAIPGMQGMAYVDDGLHHEQFAYMPEDGQPELNGVHSGGSQPDEQGLPRNQQDGRQGRQRGPRRSQPRNSEDYSLALRILVPSGMVGAIIGKEGSKIDKITSETSTQIDFHKKEEKGPPEKMVTIRGSPAACSDANQKIHELMREEVRKSSERLSPVIQMRMLIHDNLAGSVIGKKGDHLRQVKEETHTNISVSKKEETLYWPDRVITVQCRVKEGPDFEEEQQVSESECLKQCAQAEAMLSEKARKSYRMNMDEVQRQEHMMMGNPGGGAVQMYAGNAYTMNAGAPYGGQLVNWLQGYLANPYAQQHPYMQQMQPVKTYLAIPSKLAGVVIGSKGGYCQFMKKVSGAQRIVVTQDDGSGERLVEIVGTPAQQYFAQHCVYCRLSEHGHGSAELRAEIKIPLKGYKGETNVIGRLIGKNGQNIRNIQKETTTYIEVLPKGQIGPDVKEATVHIVGTFASSQYAQMRVREIISEALAQQPGGGRPGPIQS